MKRFSIILLGALAMLMASCSKNATEPIPSPDPDAWIYDATLPVPIRFNSGSLMETKGLAIDKASDMVGKEFGFFAFHNNMNGWGSTSGNTFYDNGIDGWSQNMIATCVVNPDDDTKVQFQFDGGPYYYPQTSLNNYTFFGYHARTTEVRPTTNEVNVVVEIGHDDILWAMAEAEKFSLPEDIDLYYYGYNGRYIRKSLEEDHDSDGNKDNVARHPFMTFDHLTSCVTFNAKTIKSDFANHNTGKDLITVTNISIVKTPVKAMLCVASKNLDELGNPVHGKLDDKGRSDFIGTIGPESPISVELTEDSQSLYDEPFFIMPSESITVQIEYSVSSGDPENKTVDFVSEYTLVPEVKEGEKAGEMGFFAGYKYSYNFIVYTPERIVIEAEVEPYVSAFGDGVSADAYPDDE